MQAEVERLIERVGAENHCDLEGAEFFIRTSVLTIGAKALETLVAELGRGRRDKPVNCSCGERMLSEGLRSKKVVTAVGEIAFARSLYICPRCGKARFPGDEALGIDGSHYSPGARRMMARAGCRDSYREAADDLRLLAHLNVEAKEVERVTKQSGRVVEQWTSRQASQALLYHAAGLIPPEAGNPAPTMYVSFDGTGVPIRRQELIGRKGKQSDGSARTREVKVGCVFTQTCLDEEGRPQRDPYSTTYVGAIEDRANFGARIHGEAIRRGMDQADRVVCLTDGAGYNRTIANEYFSHAIHIIDLYHARERLFKLAQLLLAAKDRPSVQSHWIDLLDDGDIEGLIDAINQHLPRSGSRRKKGMTKVHYFRKNASRMRYKRFREMGLFVGSGVIEAGCKRLIGKRLKQSGMFWSVAGANAVIALRCCLYSRRYEQFCEDQAA